MKNNSQQSGCIGCLGCFGLIVAFVIVSVAVGGGGRNGTHNDAADLGVQRVVSKKHGWIIANKMSRSNDFWSTPEDFCTGLKRGAEEVYDAIQEHRDVDNSFIGDLPGHNTVENAVRVTVLGHAKINCGLSHATSLTRIEVMDPDSHVNRRRGYIVEGLLSKQ